MPSKPQPICHLPYNNSDLRHSPSQLQIQSVYEFCEKFHQYQCEFYMLSYKLAPKAALSSLQIIDTADSLFLIIDEIHKNGYVLIDTLADRNVNYKGVTSLVLLAFTNKGFIIDGFALHQQLKGLRKVIENQKITKYCYKLANFLEDAKRDWSAFGANFFDFELLQKSIGVKKSSKNCSNTLSQRPINIHTIEQLQQRYDNMNRYMHQIRYFLEQDQQQDYSIFSYSNHYEFLLRQYQHKSTNFADEETQYVMMQNQKKRRLKENKENNVYYNQAEEITSDSYWPIIQNDRQRFVCQLLVQWRQHTAKILNCPPNKIMTFQQMLIICLENPNSILDIQDLFEDKSLCSIEKASNILQLLAFAAQREENTANQLQIRSKKNKEEKNIKNLLNELKWQGRDEWLNRKNDQSIRLYKQIVSIVELDSSVVQQFKEGMSKGVVGNSEIGRFVKYAQHFRNCNHKKLKQYYDSCCPLESNADNDDFFGWESEQQYSYISPKNASTSQTSIVSSSEKIQEKNENCTLPTIRSPSSMNSLIDLDVLSNKVDPLPENIEEIYLKAVSVKKNYQKIQKKKGGRKQGKQQLEQFVPTWQQIKMLLQA